MSTVVLSSIILIGRAVRSIRVILVDLSSNILIVLASYVPGARTVGMARFLASVVFVACGSFL